MGKEHYDYDEDYDDEDAVAPKNATCLAAAARCPTIPD